MDTFATGNEIKALMSRLAILLNIEDCGNKATFLHYPLDNLLKRFYVHTHTADCRSVDIALSSCSYFDLFYGHNILRPIFRVLKIY